MVRKNEQSIQHSSLIWRLDRRRVRSHRHERIRPRPRHRHRWIHPWTICLFSKHLPTSSTTILTPSSHPEQGIFGFKPTTYTLSMQDMLPLGFPAELNVLCSTGPMARSYRDLHLFMTTLKSSSQHLTDPLVVPLPWSLAPPLPKPIRLGIMLTDGVITPQPPVLAALTWAREKLRQHSPTTFTLKPFIPHKAAEAITNIGTAYWPDNGLTTCSSLALTGEPVSIPKA